MDEQRAEFEAWAKQPPMEWDCDRYTENEAWPNDYRHYPAQCAWEGWQAATQRQQERIAELEADIAHKDAYAEQLGRLLFKAGAERQELEAQVQALSLDAKRLDWLEAQGVAYGFQDMHEGNRWVVEGPFGTARAAIDAAIARATHKEQT